MSTLLNSAQLLRYALTCKRQVASFLKHTPLATKVIQQQHKENPSVVPGAYKNKLIMDVPEGVFQGVVDRFNGVTVDSGEGYNGQINFIEKLEKSLDHWIEVGRRGIWFKVHTEHAQSIPELTKRGFDFHHAKTGYVMMFKWLPTKEAANIPAFAHTMVGVGGLVINNKNEILAVSDRFALIPGSWKLPGGYVEPNEDLVDAAIREVKEETGVETTFDTIIAARQSHGGSFGCSDLYFVIALKPTTSKLIACPREITKVEWMPVTEYLQNPKVHETNRHFVRTYLHYKEHGIRFNSVSATHQVLNRRYCLYSVTKETPSNDVSK